MQPDARHPFIVMGDTGSGRPGQEAVAHQLLQYYEAHPFEQVILLGDNIYPNGNTILYGEERFSRIYWPLLQQGVQFKVVLGNHDIAGPLGLGWLGRWRCNQKENQRFFNMPADYYDFTYGQVHFFMLNTNRFDRNQRNWLKSAMARSRSRWKLVCGHHTIFSSGFHGGNAYLQRTLKPLLDQFEADAYLCGHEHDYERFGPIDGIHYMVSGGGGADLRGFRKPQPGSLVRQSIHHFVAFSQQSDGLAFSTIDLNGILLDQGVIQFESMLSLVQK